MPLAHNKVGKLKIKTTFLLGVDATVNNNQNLKVYVKTVETLVI